MNSSSRIGRSNSELQTSRSSLRYTKNNSPEQNSRAWANLPPTTPLHHHSKPQTKVPVLYYLSKNGHLQHPHFIEVPLSSHSLRLRGTHSHLRTCFVQIFTIFFYILLCLFRCHQPLELSSWYSHAFYVLLVFKTVRLLILQYCLYEFYC